MHLNLNHDINSVKIIYKSYLQKDFNGGIYQNEIIGPIEKFNVNSEQKRAFQIIAFKSLQIMLQVHLMIN